MNSDSSDEDFMPGDSADRRRAKLFKKKQAATKSLTKLEPVTESRISTTTLETKKKRGRPKGSKNKIKDIKTCGKRTAVLAPDSNSQAFTNQSVPKQADRNKIVLKINVSKGIVQGGDESSSSLTLDKAVFKKKRVRRAPVKISNGEPGSVSPKLMCDNVSVLEQLDIPKLLQPSTSKLPTGKRSLLYSSSCESSSTESKAIAKFSKSVEPLASSLKNLTPATSANYGSTTPAPGSLTVLSSLCASIEHASKAAKLKKRFKSVKKVKLKRKKRRPQYFTLIPKSLEDNSARSSGSSSSSEDDSSWDRRLATRDANAVAKQTDLPESSPEKGQRRPSLSPSSSPDRFPGLDLNSPSGKKPAVQHLWPNISLDRLKPTPEMPPNASQPLDIQGQVRGFFRSHALPAHVAKPNCKDSAMPNKARFPLVHEANCCMQWQARSAARGKQPAGYGTPKRKGMRRGYLTCPCQIDAGPSSANFGPSSALAMVVTAPNSTASTVSDPDTFQSNKVPRRPSFTMAISDDSGGEDLDTPVRHKSLSLKQQILDAKVPSPIRRASNSSSGSDVEFVPGPPIEEIIVSDDSNDIIFVSETASFKSKVTSAASKPKEVISCSSTESIDVICDFSTKPTATFWRSFTMPPTPHTPLSDVKPDVEPSTLQQPNPVCALPPPENTLTSFDTPLESLYPKLAGFTPEPLDFEALLDFEAEAMGTQNYGEPYSPCIPDPPCNDYDRSDEIVNNRTPERGVPIPEPVPEKEDGLVVWECPVCFEPKGDDTILATTDCTHLFCDPCIRKVAAMYGKCPVCQFALKDANIHPFRFHGYKF